MIRRTLCKRRNGLPFLFAISAALCLCLGGGGAFRLFASMQGPEVDYSKFLHTSQQHTALGCRSCHERTDNSATPRFPGHKSCTGCHRSQFTTPAIPMCVICHTDTNSGNPPLKNFPASFKERFNVRFDHAQHLRGSARPPTGCAACHGSAINRGVGFSIPANLAAHTNCYACHTPDSRSNSGREMASCGVCHERRAYRPTSTNARSYRYSFSHADHGSRDRLSCTDCHRLIAGARQTRQVSSPAASEHFITTRGMACRTCHNGRRSFGGDLGFKDCKRCHSRSTFRMPM